MYFVTVEGVPYGIVSGETAAQMVAAGSEAHFELIHASAGVEAGSPVPALAGAREV